MPRIRSIKPDFWDSADTASADLRTRLLYIAMWNWADDYGIGDGHPGRIITFAFPNDDIPAADYPRLLADVSSAFGVVFFNYLGRPYYTIPGWDKHQRTEKKAKPKEGLLEAAADAVEADKAARQTVESESPRNVADSPTQDGGSSGAGSRKLEVGKGTEEPPYPPEPEPEPIPLRKTGSEIARTKFTAIQTAPSVNARGIAHAYSSSLPTPIQTRMLGDVAKEIDSCLHAGIPPEAIAAGLEAWTASDSWSPTQIPNFVHKANNRRSNGHGKATEKALGYADAAEQLIAALGVPQ